jgi:hypothetical protein
MRRSQNVCGTGPLSLGERARVRGIAIDSAIKSSPHIGPLPEGEGGLR